MKRHKYIIIAGLAVFVFTLFTIENCNAIPAFARKYQISCQVCHSPAIPRLKPFGDEFAGNGFRLTKYESPRYFIQTGDDKLSLFRELPLAIRVDGFATYNNENEGTPDFAAPFVLKILSGGEISDHLSYYFYFLMNEAGTVAGLEDAFLIYNNFLKTGINLYVGQFQVSDPLFKSELRYTLEPYRVYGSAPGTSTVDLKYDRGVIVEKDISATGTTLVAQMVNGCGIGEARVGDIFDKDKYKNFMLRISQSISKSISIGLFGYTGRELVWDPYVQAVSDIRIFGPDLTIDIDEKIIINAQYVKRTDSKVFTGAPGEIEDDVMTSGAFGEVIYAPKGDMSKWYMTGLFNWVESDFNSLDYSSATLHAGYLLRRNMRVVGEYTRVLRPTSYGKVNVGIITAF
jgi:hypothetical protein